jgi:cellulose synthase/poly-beta-1,6-N-acetylglucosamine synthase-like glycosyltransferase
MIPTWARPEELDRCLGALEAQTHAPGQVVVVVREGDAASAAVVERRARGGAAVELVTVRTPGVASAYEAGRKVANNQVVAFTDDDSVPPPDWLARIVAHFEDPRVGGVGGRDWIDSYDGPTVRSRAVGRIRWYGRRVGDHHRGEGPPARVDVLKGVNMAFRLAAAEGVPSERRLRGSGSQRHWELGFSLAVRRAGWELVYDPEVAVAHHEARRPGPNQRGSPDLDELSGACHNEMYALLRWLPWWQKPAALAYGLVVGSREAPGLVTAFERGLRRREWRTSLSRLRAATRGRLEAIGTWLSALREAA